MDSQRLQYGSDQRPLNPKELGVLLHLVERAPHVVATEELLTRTWPGVVVGDNVLHQVVRRLRKAFGDDAHHPTYIETLPKRGYRLIAQVDAPAQRNSAQVNGADLGAKTTVVVLPFVDASQHSVDAYLADGLTFEIHSQLSKIADLRLLSRSAVQDLVGRGAKPFEIGRRLNADVVLEGTLRASDDRLRLIVQLSRVADEIQLWSHTLDHDLDDLFKMHTDLAIAIATALQARVARDELKRLQRLPTTSMAAYRLVQHAREFGGGHAKENPIGIELLEQAVALDPNYADAYAWLAWRLVWAAELGHREHLERARECAEHAVRLDPNSGWSHYGLAYVLISQNRYGSAIRELRRSLALEPSGDFVLLDLCHHLTWTGQLEEALVNAMRAHQQKPRDANTRWHASIPLLLLGNDRRTAAWLRRAIAELPGDNGRFRCFRGLMNLNLLEGNLEKARIGVAETYEQVPWSMEAVLCSADVLLCLRDWAAVKLRLASWVQAAPFLRTSTSLLIRTIRTTYGFALHQMGDRDEGTRLMTDSVKINCRAVEQGAIPSACSPSLRRSTRC